MRYHDALAAVQMTRELSDLDHAISRATLSPEVCERWRQVSNATILEIASLIQQGVDYKIYRKLSYVLRSYYYAAIDL